MTFPCNKFLISVIACLAMSVGAHAQSPTKARLADTDALMSRYTGDVPGASLLVVKDGKPIIRRGFGYANLEKRERF